VADGVECRFGESMKNKIVLMNNCGFCRFCFLFVILFIIFHIQADTLVTPNDSRINYYGRFDFTDSAKPGCSWSGAIIEASFPGPTIGMRMEYANAFYDIEIDGKLDTVISIGSGKDFIFRRNLSEQVHTVRIRLRSENHWGAGIFSGLYLANGKQLSPPPAKPNRKIEFIGDSYTAGYGIESSSRTCSSDQLNKYTNVNRAFARLVTESFHAQSIILGWSGAGMVRNYGESTKRSSAPYPVHYDQTLGEAGGGGKWDYSKWIPELVVICLGTNDYSTTPNPDDSMYVGDYHKFITRVLTNYPAASVLCVSTGEGSFENNVKKVVAEEHSMFNHPKVYFAAYPGSRENSGCDWHPSINDNVKVAAALVDTIMKKLSWDTSASVAVISPYQSEKNFRTNTKLSGRMVNELFTITLAGKNVAAVQLALVNMRGEVIESLITGADGLCTFNMVRYSPGVYLAGNPDYGWVRVAVR
jgi:lysophospholipase L1-like esterase